MAIHIDRQDGETDMRRSRIEMGRKTAGPIHGTEDTRSSSPSSSRPTSSLRYYSRSEIARHSTEESAWIVAGDDVYDVTEYMHQHPAGKEPILRRTGGAVDCTQDLLFHSKRGRTIWKERCLIGKVTANEALNGTLVLEKPWWAFWE